jgi:hypothetical protein
MPKPGRAPRVLPRLHVHLLDAVYGGAGTGASCQTHLDSAIAARRAGNLQSMSLSLTAWTDCWRRTTGK